MTTNRQTEQARLIAHLKELHLPTIRQCYEEEAERAPREKAPPGQETLFRSRRFQETLVLRLRQISEIDEKRCGLFFCNIRSMEPDGADLKGDGVRCR